MGVPANAIRAAAHATTRGLVLAALTALACLAFAAAHDPPTRTLRQIATGAAPMSRAESAPASAEPLWCADPSSPHCLPAVPHAPRPELGDHLDLWLPSPLNAPAPVFSLQTWPRPHAETPRVRSHVDRLERPPRA